MLEVVVGMELEVVLDELSELLDELELVIVGSEVVDAEVEVEVVLVVDPDDVVDSVVDVWDMEDEDIEDTDVEDWEEVD